MPPLSILKIAEIAAYIRTALKLDSTESINILSIIEAFSSHELLNLDICEDKDAVHKGEGFYDPTTKTITLPDSIYETAYSGDGRARFTVAHEFGHFALDHKASFARAIGDNWKAYEDSEWQADTFASNFLAPAGMVCKYSDVIDVAEAFGLSKAAAGIALEKAKKAKP